MIIMGFLNLIREKEKYVLPILFFFLVLWICDLLNAEWNSNPYTTTKIHTNEKKFFCFKIKPLAQIEFIFLYFLSRFFFICSFQVCCGLKKNLKEFRLFVFQFTVLFVMEKELDIDIVESFHFFLALSSLLWFILSDAELSKF